MIDKLSLSEKENEILAKGIAIGVGLGTALGALLNYVTLGFAAGGVIGILGALTYSLYLRFRNKKIIRNKESIIKK